MKRLIYVSTLLDVYNTTEQMLSAVKSWQERNSAMELSGHLYWDKSKEYRSILQILEGEDANINAMWERIRQDSRHTDVTLLSFEDIVVRAYQKWDYAMTNPEFSAPMSNSTRDYLFKSIIGTGGSSTVVLGIELRTGKEYAIKMISKRRLTENLVTQILTERTLGTTLNHPFIHKLYKSFQNPSHIYFVTPFAKRGDLYSSVTKREITFEAAMFYLCEIVCGLHYLHRHDVIHNDLKLENVLVCDDGHVVLTDFGVSFIAVKCASRMAGTPMYFAPEAITRKEKTSASDMWALSVMLFEMFMKKVDWQAKERQDMFDMILKSDLATQYERNHRMEPHPVVGGLIRMLGDHEPESRATCESTIAYLKLTKVVDEWANVENRRLIPPDIPDEARHARNTLVGLEFDLETENRMTPLDTPLLE